MAMRSFDILGSVAIVKFPRGSSASLKKKRAEKIMKENNGIKAVLEKSGKFKGRLRKMETKFVAGEKTKEVLYKENGCVFRFNIDDAYFSPRLSNERKEIADAVGKNDKVLVMFAGVAPYSIVIAKKSRAMVWSNEINKRANKYARLNAELNGLKSRIVFLDGDIKKIAKKIMRYSHGVNLKKFAKLGKNYSLKFSSSNYVDLNFRTTSERGNLNIPRYFDVIVMPRPQLKDSFLKEAFSLSKRGARIFYYDFCKADEIDEIKEKVKLEAKKARKKIKITKVKKAGEVAPYRFRIRIDFKVL